MKRPIQYRDVVALSSGFKKEAGVYDWAIDTSQLEAERNVAMLEAYKKGFLHGLGKDISEPFAMMRDTIKGKLPLTSISPERREKFRQWYAKHYGTAVKK